MPGQDLVGAPIGDASTAEVSINGNLVEALYEQLRRLARRRLRREADSPTLQATALVHEAWLRLAGVRRFEDEQHYANAAALAMRRILVDRARARASERNGGTHERVPIEWADGTSEESLDFLALDAALEQLSRIDARGFEIVQLRFFAGLSVEETARVTGESERTVKREWATARLWLHDQLRKDGQA
ncbi:MAG: ECF-type sigma factor [Planctomycetota bacterium]|nr:ECF-type sigma factor [Planctomycetota bacterium]